MVGSIDTSEFVVAVGGSIGFLLALGSQGIDWGYAGALLAGGVIAAPLAAWLVKHLAARILGVLAGGVIILTNLKTIAESLGADGFTVSILCAAWAVAWLQMLTIAVRAERKSRIVPAPPVPMSPLER